MVINAVKFFLRLPSFLWDGESPGLESQGLQVMFVYCPVPAGPFPSALLQRMFPLPWPWMVPVIPAMLQERAPVPHSHLLSTRGALEHPCLGLCAGMLLWGPHREL